MHNEWLLTYLLVDALWKISWLVPNCSDTAHWSGAGHSDIAHWLFLEIWSSGVGGRARLGAARLSCLSMPIETCRKNMHRNPTWSLQFQVAYRDWIQLEVPGRERMKRYIHHVIVSKSQTHAGSVRHGYSGCPTRTRSQQPECKFWIIRVMSTTSKSESVAMAVRVS